MDMSQGEMLQQCFSNAIASVPHSASASGQALEKSVQKWLSKIVDWFL